MLKEISSVVIEETIEKLYSFAKKILKRKYGQNSTICLVTLARDGNLSFVTEYTNGYIDANFLNVPRKQVGQNILQRFGPNFKNPPVVFLVISLSAIKKLGIKKTFKFFKEWIGKSELEGKTVIIYKTFWS